MKPDRYDELSGADRVIADSEELLRQLNENEITVNEYRDREGLPWVPGWDVPLSDLPVGDTSISLTIIPCERDQADAASRQCTERLG